MSDYKKPDEKLLADAEKEIQRIYDAIEGMRITFYEKTGIEMNPTVRERHGEIKAALRCFGDYLIADIKCEIETEKDKKDSNHVPMRMQYM